MSASQPKRGNRPKEYETEYDRELGQERGRVAMWRQRIARERKNLAIEERTLVSQKADAYLENRVKVKGQYLYLNYAMPTMEEVLRRSLPSLPAPSVEARSDSADAPMAVDMMGLPLPGAPTLADYSRELVDLWFNSDDAQIKKACENLQWDDAHSGIGISKVILEGKYEEASPRIVEDVGLAAIEVDRAEMEHDDIANAAVQTDDAHYLHLVVHMERYDMLRAYSGPDMGRSIQVPEIEPLWAHIIEHKAFTLLTKSEGPVLERVPWYSFIYDTSDVWGKRGWETEKCCMRVAELIEMGCRNVNIENCPPTADDGNLPYEDKRCWVWRCHDRRSNRELIIAADGPENGLFLMDRKWPWKGVDIYVPLVMRPYKSEQTEGASTLYLMMPVLDELASVDFYIRRHREMHASYKKGMPIGLDAKIKSQIKNPDAYFYDVTPEMAAMGRQDYEPPPIPDNLLVDRSRLLDELRRIAGGIDAQDMGTANPHKVSATESYNRAESREAKKETRQERIGDFLSVVAKTMLVLWRRLATTKQMVRVLGPTGADYLAMDPSAMPEDLDTFFDVAGQSEAGRTAHIQAFQIFLQTAKELGIPLDGQKALEAFGRRLGIRHPEHYRAQLPIGMPGQPAEGMSAPMAEEQGGPVFGPQPQPAQNLKIA